MDRVVLVGDASTQDGMMEPSDGQALLPSEAVVQSIFCITSPWDTQRNASGLYYVTHRM